MNGSELFTEVSGIWDAEQKGAYCPDCYHPMELSFLQPEADEWTCEHCMTVYYHPRSEAQS